MTTLISSEGLSSLGARAMGTYFFEYADFNEARADPNVSAFATAEAERVAAADALDALKASARAKLVAGTPLTEEEAATLVI